jgi:hypothetical protein
MPSAVLLGQPACNATRARSLLPSSDSRVRSSEFHSHAPDSISPGQTKKVAGTRASRSIGQTTL